MHMVIATCDVSQSQCRLKKNGCVTEATEKRATHSKYTANETMKSPDRARGVYKCFYHSYNMSVCACKYRFEIQKIQCVIVTFSLYFA